MSPGSRVYSAGSHVLERVVPGIRLSRSQVPVFADAWEQDNRTALASKGRLWVALGDSAAQGVGASTKDGGWVGQLRPLLDSSVSASEEPWRLVNLSRSGARTRDVLETQLPELHAIPDVALVTCAIGGNDLLHRTATPRLAAQMEELLDALPVGAVVATLSKGLGRRKPAVINDLIRRRAADRGLRVADVWTRTGPPWRGKYARDGLHPNEVGYAEWTAAFADALGLTDDQ